MNKHTVFTVESSKEAFTAPERQLLKNLLDLSPTATLEALAHAAVHEKLTIERARWALDLMGSEESAVTTRQGVATEFSAHEQNILYTKFGYTRAYEPQTVVIDTIEIIAALNDWSLSTLRTFVETRAAPPPEAILK